VNRKPLASPPSRDGLPAEVAALVAKLADPDATVRGKAAKELGTLGRPECVAPLRHVLRNDPDTYVRRMAIVSLGKIGSPAIEAVPDLAQALRDESPFLTEFAAAAIVEITGKALPYRKGMTEEEVAKLVEKHLAGLAAEKGK
jgi:vesicle coat complex subunit